MEGEVRLGEAKMSLIYVFQCCLQIRMGSFRTSAALFPHNVKGEGGKGWDREGESLGEEVWFFCWGFIFSFLQSTFTSSCSHRWTLYPLPPQALHCEVILP